MTFELFPFAVTALDRAALALVAGAAAVWIYLLPAQAGRGAGGPRPLLFLALALLVVTSAGDLLSRTAALADVGLGEAWPYLGRALTRSDYGAYWQLRAAAWAVLLALALLIARRGAGPPAAWGLAAGAAVIIFAASATGHAGDGGALALPNLVNVVHVAAACLWGGSVVVYALRVLPDLCRPGAPAQILARSAARLSTLAGAALAAVLASGVYNAWHQLPDWPALWESGYGRVLLIKLAAVGVMMAIGAWNRFRIVPAIEARARRPEAGPDDGAIPALGFLRVLRVDAAVFLCVLAGAALLGMQTPPSH
ncbi:MAG: copper resistance D family protein [Acetobacteraceae bacterium]